jgi:NADPH:quinone reductase-like Zn-dependent oxidoreductase
MKAVQLYAYGGVDQLHYQDVADPKPGPDEVLVKVAATSVNPIDWKIRRGDLKNSVPLQFPVILGRDLAGEVVETGSNVKRWKIGQRVMGLVNRTYAELLTASSDALAPTPDGLDDRQAGALPLVTTTGAELMNTIAPERGSTVLVTGAYGNVGRTAVYVAKQHGARVIAAVREAQKERAKSLGADQVVATDNDDEIESLPQVDAIADTVGHELIAQLLPKLKPHGTLGSVLGKPKAAEGEDIRVAAVLSHPDATLLVELANAVQTRALSIPVAREFPLSQAAEAQALSESGNIDGKILLIP